MHLCLTETKHLKNIFKKLCNFCNVNDIWRKTHEKDKAFTWIDPADMKHQSRIDLTCTTLYLSNLINTCNIITAPVPDHKAVETVITINKRKKILLNWNMT